MTSTREGGSDPEPSGEGGAAERIAGLEADNTALARRVAELEQALAQAGASREPGSAERMSRLLAALIEHSPSLIFVKDVEGRYLLINRRYEEDCAVTREQLCGKTDHAWLPAASADGLRALDRKIIEGGVPVQFEETLPVRGEDRDYFTLKFPLFDDDGALLGLCGIATDITGTKRAEKERDAMRERVLVAQSEALMELSTPLVPIADGVLAMPLVGQIDPARAARIMEALLEGISQQGAHTAILDITGVRSVDRDVADALVRAAHAAGLLGARVVLSGIGPDVARALVELGSDLGAITTVSTLQSAIARALGPAPEGTGARRRRI
jgi:PAS domain S-box-containing protein